MSTATISAGGYEGDDQGINYRALHTGALIGLVLGLLSLVVVLVAATAENPLSALQIAPIPLVAMVISGWSLLKIRRSPDLYTGETLAIVGLLLSVVFLVTGVGYACRKYAVELPPGYERISFNGMKPDELQERNGLLVPPDISSLEGKNVFIKGYIRPDSVTVPRGIDQFLLVRDNNQCCFGDMSKIKYYDQVYVKLTGDHRVDFSRGVFNIGGVLHIEPQNAMPGSPKTVFTLTADYAK